MIAQPSGQPPADIGAARRDGRRGRAAMPPPARLTRAAMTAMTMCALPLARLLSYPGLPRWCRSWRYRWPSRVLALNAAVSTRSGADPRAGSMPIWRAKAAPS